MHNTIQYILYTGHLHYQKSTCGQLSFREAELMQMRKFFRNQGPEYRKENLNNDTSYAADSQVYSGLSPLSSVPLNSVSVRPILYI